MKELTLIDEQNLSPILFPEELERAKEFANDQHALSTRIAYRSDINVFQSWCKVRLLESLPATPQTVAMFLASQAEGGVCPSTLSRRLAAIKYLHSLAGHETPTTAEIVKATLRGIRRGYGVAPDQKAPATAEVISEMLRHIPNTLQGVRDRALILLGFAGAFRRSELVALNVEDLQESEMGFKVIIRKSKTDQEGAGQTIAIYGGSKLKVVEAVNSWIAVANITSGPLFRRLLKGNGITEAPLTTTSVAQIIKRYAQFAGFNHDNFSGHSLRSGYVTSAAESGANLLKIMEVTRHESVNTLKGYVRSAELFKDHSGAAFL